MSKRGMAMSTRIVMKRSALAALVGLAGALLQQPELAAQPELGTSRVTIHNTTRGQVFSPVLVIAHNTNFRLFELGQFARDELVPLAEEGDIQALRNLAAAHPGVGDVAVSAASLLAGGIEDVPIRSSNAFPLVTIVGRLGGTNDGFFAVRDLRVERFGMVTEVAYAYDAGSEENTERCTDIAGPPCNHPHARAVLKSEERVYFHPGIKGIADLPLSLGWDDFVAEVKVRSNGG